MEKRFVLSCESTVDMPYSYIHGREIPVIFYTYVVDGEEYVDDMCRTPGAIDEFYARLEAGKLPSTSQIPVQRYADFFSDVLKTHEGDLLHIAFGSGLTPSVQNAEAAAKSVMEANPGRRIIVIDSYCGSSGYGMLVDYAADMRDDGRTLEETENWVNAHRRNIHHQFYSTELKYFRRSGRVSGPTAVIASILGICPIMRLDVNGKIIAYDKVKGKANAIKLTLDMMAEHAENGEEYAGKCYICHSNCIDMAEKTREALLARFKNVKEVRICDIGSVIASHCGPGTVAVFFLGDERAPYKK